MPQRCAASQHRKGRASDCRMARRMLVLRCLYPAVPGAGGDYTGTSADEPDEICRRYPGAGKLKSFCKTALSCKWDIRPWLRIGTVVKIHYFTAVPSLNYYMIQGKKVQARSSISFFSCSKCFFKSSDARERWCFSRASAIFLCSAATHAMVDGRSWYLFVKMVSWLRRSSAAW